MKENKHPFSKRVDMHLNSIEVYGNEYAEYKYYVDKKYNPNKYLNEDPLKKLYIIVPIKNFKLMLCVKEINEKNEVAFMIEGTAKTKKISKNYVTLADASMYDGMIVYYHEYARLSIYDEDDSLFELDSYTPKWKVIENICKNVLIHFLISRSACDDGKYEFTGKQYVCIKSNN